MIDRAFMLTHHPLNPRRIVIRRPILFICCGEEALPGTGAPQFKIDRVVRPAAYHLGPSLTLR